MAHPEEYQYLFKIKSMFRDYFCFKNVVDIGSLDVNGNNRILFEYCKYVGVDIVAGNNVDVVMPGHKFKPASLVDTVISTECFEHDPYFEDTLLNMYDMLKPKGLLIFTCATTGRAPHGPGPIVNGEMYYKNITPEDIFRVLDPEKKFDTYAIECEIKSPTLSDIRFYGRKNNVG